MSAPKHTAGPWAYLDIGEVVREDDFDVTVATLDYGRENAEADGSLIAAAPDLLEALTKATTQIAVWRSINGDMVGALAELEDECRAAIAKATGEAA